MVREPKRYKEQFDYVKVESQQRFNIDKRDWTCGANFPLEEGEEAIVARNGRGMSFFFDNGFLEIIDSEPVNDPDLEVNQDKGEEESFECDRCGDSFDSEKGLKSHSSQKHNNKNEEEQE